MKLFVPVGKAVAKMLRPVNYMLDPIERRYAGLSEARFRHPLIFIIGSPRSGSTLLYQVLTSSIECGYFTNTHAALYGAPALVQRAFGQVLHSPSVSTFESHDGQSKGFAGPAECGQFWYRWFAKDPQYVAADAVDIERLKSLRGVVGDLVNSFDAPLVFKNLTCGMRLHALGRLFPEALFVVLKRQPIWAAQSLLLGRKRLFDDEAMWWSLQPPNVAALRRLSPTHQVARQVVDIYKTIARDALAVGPDRFRNVDYESFCDDPRTAIAGLVEWVRQHGWSITTRSMPPERFPRSEAVRLDNPEFQELERAVEQALRSE